jgi:chlorobactene glucosyltransferase
MMDYFLNNQIIQIALLQVVILLVILSNNRQLHRLRKHKAPSFYPQVSILVPVRNEEENIRSCLQSLLEQDYPFFEVLVLDDQSRDGTLQILTDLASSQPKLKILNGSPTPKGMAGKNWACTQLADQAQGDLLFFTDADTLHMPGTLRSTVTALLGEEADMLTGFPRQLMGSWGERLLVPFFAWAFLCFTPLWLAYRLRLPALSSAVGQMMLFQRKAYQAIGGHAHLGSLHLDDLMLARRIKRAGFRWRVVNITDLVTCRMYQGSLAAFNGFAKNYFAVFDYRLLPYLFVFGWLAIMFWKPLFLLGLVALGLPTQATVEELLLTSGLSLSLWIFAYIVLKIPVGLAILYPITILAVEAAALKSLVLGLTGQATWKDRPLVKPRWKWI